MSSTDRAAFTAGLRRIIDALEANEDLPLPWSGSDSSPLMVFVDTKEEVVAWRRLIGTVEKNVSDSGSYGFSLTGAVDGVHVHVLAPREEVCTARVVGTETVEKKVPVAFETKTETRNIVEWDCHPLLADVTA